jgi:epoxyqueuosine reductase
MLMDDTSPVVRGAAIWAMSRLSPEIFAREKQLRFANELDPSVRAEWTLT